MASISMSDIYCNGTIFENDDEQLIYLTPSFPQRYTSNTWIYKKDAYPRAMAERLRTSTSITYKSRFKSLCV
ncbi:acetyltransferase [Staphylococcus aureus]|nr:acetyltransferase [Staphylococcus aureus]